MASVTDSEAHGIDLVHRYLDENRVAHEVVDHEQTLSAAQEAQAAGVPPTSRREDDGAA